MQPRFEEYLSAVDETLRRYLGAPCDPRRVLDAMGYSAFAGGKRIRPLLTLEFARLCGGDWQDALPFAAGIEMVQTYSLIHDDLPCMDNSDLRRGRPSCHRQFDEATALLAGDGLLTMAFEALADAPVPAPRVVRAVSALAGAIGVQGMIGGQELDLAHEGLSGLPLETIRQTNEKKTAALLTASCVLGVLSAGGDKAQMQAARDYGRALGLAFQVVDDILDATATAETLGKPVGSDTVNRKSTYVTALGLEKARAFAAQYTEQALEALSLFPEHEDLSALTRSLLSRDH